MKLFLVRHGEAEAHAAADAARALTALGMAQADATGQWLAQHCDADVQLLASPYRRAQETAQVIQRRFPALAITTVAGITPDDDPRSALEAIAASVRQQQVIVVSHMPLVAGLHQWLCDGVITGGCPFALAEARMYVLDVLAPGMAEVGAGFIPGLD